MTSKTSGSASMSRGSVLVGGVAALAAAAVPSAGHGMPAQTTNSSSGKDRREGEHVMDATTRMDVPKLILHGDDDQIVTVGISVRGVEVDQRRDAQIVPWLLARDVFDQQNQINANLLAFIKS
jgi:hypothetical protein